MVLATALACMYLLLAPAPWIAAQPAGGEFVAADGSFSVRYPAGWSAVQNGAAVGISNASTAEEITVLSLPIDAGKTALEYAEAVVAQLRSNNPGLLTSKPIIVDQSVRLEIAYAIEGRLYSGSVFVDKDRDRATWFSYAAPPSRGRDAAVALLQAVRGSFARRAGGQQGRATKPSAAPAVVGSRLVGSWSGGAFGGSMSYTFRADGTYRQVVLSTGGIAALRGIATWDGKYSLSGDELTLRRSRSSWKPTESTQYPAYSDQPDSRVERFRVRMPNENELTLVDLETSSETGLQRDR
jgi:hypothetical protein